MQVSTVLPRPLPKQKVRQYCYSISDLENIEQENRAEPLHAQILQDIIKWDNVIVVVFLAKSRFRYDVNNSWKVTAFSMYK